MKKVIVLTGAGISAESGLKTFRDNNGLWENHSIYEVATPEAFQDNPKLVHRFYNLRRAQLISSEVKPNKAHYFLSNLEKNSNLDLLIVTQNVDDLHERSGSKNVLHMHGELLKIRCINCHSSYRFIGKTSITTKCNECNHIGTMRPDIVWFGEEVKFMERIYKELSQCELFIAIGTSGAVFPASHFVQAVPSSCFKVEINQEQTQISSFFDKHYLGKASDQVGHFVSDLDSGSFF